MFSENYIQQIVLAHLLNFIEIFKIKSHLSSSVFVFLNGNNFDFPGASIGCDGSNFSFQQGPFENIRVDKNVINERLWQAKCTISRETMVYKRETMVYVKNLG